MLRDQMEKQKVEGWLLAFDYPRRGILACSFRRSILTYFFEKDPFSSTFCSVLAMARPARFAQNSVAGPSGKSRSYENSYLNNTMYNWKSFPVSPCRRAGRVTL